MTDPFTVPQRANLKWAAVDLDGTLAKGVWTPEKPYSGIGNPIEQNVNKAWDLIEAGYKVIIHTSRPWSDYELIESWLNKFVVPYSKIVCGKLLAAVYVDDRGVNAADGKWVPEW